MKRAAVLASIVVVSALGQQPHVQNARLENRTVSGGLDATLRAILNAQNSPAWVGYSVPIIPGDRQMCCWSDSVRGCFLEPHTTNQTVVLSNNQTVKLEGPTELVVLYRVENRQVGKVRSFSPECELDAGGLPFVWLTGVNAAESVKFLETIATDNSGASREQTRRADAALSAIAMHADPAALDVLVGQAHNAKSPHMRGQALFWLALRAGQKVAESAINDAIANDPETEVKKKAVFALAQMPSGEGVPLLIQVARTNRNLEVRKQAMFWLGQSKDERALAFIEQILH